MGSKRSLPVGEGTPAHLPAKRSKVIRSISSQPTSSRIATDKFHSKTHQPPRNPGLTGLSEGREAFIPQSADSRLLLLKNLVGEMVNEPDVLPADPTIMQAISLLNGAFTRSDELSATISNLSPAHQTQGPLDSPGGTDPWKHRTPSLPPILDRRLEEAVFTHPACGKTHDTTYDRLEILGDAYIELIATRVVWEKFPGIPSGRISQIRELLVKNETLAGFAQLYAFDRKARVPANYSDQPKRWTKTKGDIFEAYVAAVILSRSVDGYHVAEQWLTELWLPKLASLGQQRADLRAKEALAKKVMGKGIRLEYVEERPAVEHKGSGTQTFFIGVYLTGWGWTHKHLGSGQGPSKAAAGDEAARDALSDIPLIAEVVTAKRLNSAGGGQARDA